MQLLKLQSTGIQQLSPGAEGAISKKSIHHEEQSKLINVKKSNKEYETKLKQLQNRLRQLEAQEKRNQLIERMAIQKTELLQAFQYRNKMKQEIKQELQTQTQNDIFEKKQKISKMKQKQKKNKEKKMFVLQSYKFSGSAEVRNQKDQLKQQLEDKRKQDMDQRQSIRDQILSNELQLKKQKILEAQNKINSTKYNIKSQINDEQTRLIEKQNLIQDLEFREQQLLKKVQHNFQKSLEAQQKLGSIINKNRTETKNPRDSDFSMSSTVTSQMTKRKNIDEGVKLLVPLSTRIKPAPKQLFKSSDNAFY